MGVGLPANASPRRLVTGLRLADQALVDLLQTCRVDGAERSEVLGRDESPEHATQRLQSIGCDFSGMDPGKSWMIEDTRVVPDCLG